MSEEVQARKCDECGVLTPVDEWEFQEVDPAQHHFGDDGWYICPCCGAPVL